MFCVDSVTLETRLINVFNQTFERCDTCKLYGIEYFRGNVENMMTCILQELEFPCVNLDSLGRIEKSIKYMTNQVKQKDAEIKEKDAEIQRKDAEIMQLKMEQSNCLKMEQSDYSTETPNCPDDGIYCGRCMRTFKSIKYLKAHNNVCKGVEPLTCPTCYCKFRNRKAKYRHVKAGKCVQPMQLTQTKRVCII
jgi:hypothetical protein